MEWQQTDDKLAVRARGDGRVELYHELSTFIDGKTHPVTLTDKKDYLLPCGKTVSPDAVQKGECIGIRLNDQPMKWSYPIKSAYQRDDGVIVAVKKIVVPDGGSLWLTPTTNLSHRCGWLGRSSILDDGKD